MSHLGMSKKSSAQKPSRKKLSVVQNPANVPGEAEIQKLKASASTIGYIHARLLKSEFKADEFMLAHGAFLWLEDMSRQTIALINELEPPKPEEPKKENDSDPA